MEFEIKMDYTVEDLDAYWRAFYLKRPETPGGKRASPKMHRNLGLFFLAMGALTAFVLRPPARGLGIAMGLMEMVLGLMLLYSGYYLGSPRSSSRWVKRAWEQYQASGKIYSCRFTQEGVWVHDSKSDHRYDYEGLEALWEDGERFYLMMPKNAAYILRKDAFVRGAPGELPAFWAGRTGKTVEEVK